jgi:hypothetical protein
MPTGTRHDRNALMDWGLVLTAVGVIGVPVAIGLTMGTTTPGEFRFVRGCFIVAAILTLGSLIWLTHEYPLGLIKIASAAIIGATIAVGLVVAFDWIKKKEDIAIPRSAKKLFAQCDNAQPITFPADGRIYQIQINAIPGPYGGGIAVSTAPPGGPIDLGVRNTSRCQFTNYSDEPLFKVSVAFHMTFMEAIKDKVTPTSMQSGAVTLDRDWVVEIPKIDAGKDAPFTIYLFNMTSQFVRVTLPNKASLSNGESIDLIQPKSWGMHFAPNPTITP